MRDKIGEIVNSARVQNAIIWIIIFNAALLGLQTSKATMAAIGPLILMLDQICLAIFVVELALKLFAFGPRFFRSGWNLFDFVVVAIALAPAGGPITVLRALRVLRVFRVVSVSPSLRKVVDGLVRALPGMGSVMLLLGMIFYIGAVMATNLFGGMFDEWFGTVGRSAYSLFQIMTLESWSMGIVRPVMKEFPHAWAFFVPFIMMTTFATVNLFVGLVVNSLQEAAAVDSDKERDAFRDEVLVRLEGIEQRLPAPILPVAPSLPPSPADSPAPDGDGSSAASPAAPLTHP
ncbi:MAG TPA: ion transporter [Paracoccaceae bacterium]|nr:ion transporter [Paracoccaceae bacterium]HMO70352.1 ion transporter [Paracoccaceae bacterium]